MAMMCTKKVSLTIISVKTKKEKILFTSESVTEGHPDKVCDAVSDAILDACFAQDPMSRVACETASCTGFVLVTGEITTNAQLDIPASDRKYYKSKKHSCYVHKSYHRMLSCYEAYRTYL